METTDSIERSIRNDLQLDQGLILIAVFGIKDPLRKEIKSAV